MEPTKNELLTALKYAYELIEAPSLDMPGAAETAATLVYIKETIDRMERAQAAREPKLGVTK